MIHHNCIANYGFSDCCGDLEKLQRERDEYVDKLLKDRPKLSYIRDHNIIEVSSVGGGYFDVDGNFNIPTPMRWQNHKHFKHKIVYTIGFNKITKVFN